MTQVPVRAVLWDFGGVILSSPFAAFAAYERRNGLPAGLLRRINAARPDDNAWARLERGEIDIATFRRLFESEAATLGHEVDALAVLGALRGEIRPTMVAALRSVAARYRTACLTNNIRCAGPADERAAAVAEVMALFDEVLESSKLGIRKPDPRFYTLACERLGVACEETVFLDDLGVNLKPARALGIRTVKVVDPETALDELEALLGHPVRDAAGLPPAQPARNDRRRPGSA